MKTINFLENHLDDYYSNKDIADLNDLYLKMDVVFSDDKEMQDNRSLYDNIAYLELYKQATEIEHKLYQQIISNLMEKSNEVSHAKKVLGDHGYYTDNLWCLNDVQDRFECDDEQALMILDTVLQSEHIITTINEQICEVSESEFHLTFKNDAQ